jgi:beta-lactamase regulating signal transducer with metallopeptidase domain
MTITRMIAVLSVMTLIGIAVVSLRVSQARYTRQIQQLRFREVELRQRLWEQEMELARLRSPRMIRERAVRLGLDDEMGITETASVDHR